MAKRKNDPGDWNGNSTERGKQAEKAFLNAWSDKEKRPDFIKLVRKGTISEDLYEKTDAVVNLTHILSLDIRIQIKSNFIGLKKRKQFLKQNIAPISIRSNHTPEMIRRNTLKSILQLLSYMCDGTLPKN